MKADIKLCAISFGVVTLPVFHPLGQGRLPGACARRWTDLNGVCSSEEATFHVYGTLVVYGEVTVVMKVNVWCPLMKNKVIRPSFFWRT
jgi:hypothetical protein